MKKAFILYAVAVTVVAVALLFAWRNLAHRCDRYAANQHALVARLDTARLHLDQRNASIEVLRLRCREYETLHAADAAEIRALGIRLRRLEAASVQVAATQLDTTVRLRDTLILRRDTLSLRPDTLRHFRWSDPWIRIEGVIGRDSVACRLTSCDTLRQIIHRVPRRFLFFRWGTKAIRQEIRSANPHTRLIYSDYVIIER